MKSVMEYRYFASSPLRASRPPFLPLELENESAAGTSVPLIRALCEAARLPPARYH
jgi:hypothetical protein